MLKLIPSLIVVVFYVVVVVVFWDLDKIVFY